MKTVVGIFKYQQDAVYAIEAMLHAEVPPDKINVLLPGGDSAHDVENVRTADAEQPGVGKALGGVVGGALGVAGGLQLGTSIASIFIPGVGPVLAAGFAAAALFGAAGVAGGTAVGETLEDATKEGLPKDELFLYEDALRQDRSVVIVFADDDRADFLRDMMRSHGAETTDAARQRWWLGLRDAEREKYSAPIDFDRDEEIYRAGFQAALHPETRGQSYEQAAARLQWFFPEIYQKEAFRVGYESGRVYYNIFCTHNSLRPAA